MLRERACGMQWTYYDAAFGGLRCAITVGATWPAWQAARDMHTCCTVHKGVAFLRVSRHTCG